jgi:hypothetical protein
MEDILGDRVIVDLRSRAASVAFDEATAAFSSVTASEVAILPSAGDASGRRALVELRQFHGGMAPHVLLGGHYVPGGQKLVLRVECGEAGATRRTCKSRLRLRKLVPGLPSELAESALAGLKRTATLPPGVITVDRAGFDPVETSPMVVELVAELLGWTLSLDSAMPTEEQLRAWLNALN